MTTKDYKNIAKVLYGNRRNLNAEQIDLLFVDFTIMLKANNENFDSDKFLKECNGVK